MSLTRNIFLNGLVCISMIFAMSCGGKEKASGKSDKEKFSPAQVKQMKAKILELKEDMRLVMDTQQCIFKNCEDYYAAKSRDIVNDLNKQIAQTEVQKTTPAKLKKLEARVGAVLKVQVGLLKNSCTICAQ